MAARLPPVFVLCFRSAKLVDTAGFRTHRALIPMAQKIWEKPLQDGFVIRYRMETLWGKWLGFSVVLIYEDECITRYDIAHGKPHRDVLGKRKGLMEKVWHDSFSLKEAFEYAHQDLCANYREYYTFYASH